MYIDREFEAKANIKEPLTGNLIYECGHKMKRLILQILDQWLLPLEFLFDTGEYSRRCKSLRFIIYLFRPSRFSRTMSRFFRIPSSASPIILWKVGQFFRLLLPFTIIIVIPKFATCMYRTENSDRFERD